MDNEDLKEASKEAWQQVLAHPRADLKNYLTEKGIVFKGDRKPVADRCPLCEGKKKFGLLPADGGGWLYKCFGKDCPSGGDSGGIDKFIQVEQGIDWKQARTFLHNLTGIPQPFEEAKDRREREARKTAEKKEDTKPETEEKDGPSLTEAQPPEPEDDDMPEPEMPVAEETGMIRVPDIGRNPYEAVWVLLSLLPNHRAELKKKRGMTDEWIEAFGLKSATPQNREILAPILEMFPPNELLRAGIAERDPRDRKLKISDQLCGRERNEETNQWENQPRIIIPYVDDRGRIILLRPHKRGLSNSRWRDREAIAEDYEKQYHNLRIPFGEVYLANRSEQWAKTVVICEGEHKAMALQMCGIPALAFQGIHYINQNKESKEAVERTAEILRKHHVREVIVVFDTEDKSHKDFKDRFEAETFARFTAEELEQKGFRGFWGTLPDEWMEDKKADWDSRLAWHVRSSKSPEDGIRKAATEFTRLLTDRGGKQRRVFETSYQVDFLNAKEDVINQAIYRLRYEPEIFIGGKREMNLASEIQNFCLEKFAHRLNVKALCQALRETRGGYYKAKNPSEKQADDAQKILDIIREEIEELEADHTRSEEKDLHLRRLRATRTACYTILYRLPKPFTDFSAESRYKVLVIEPDGSPRHDRLIVFRDQNGVRSRQYQMSPKLMGSSQELRKFFLSMGHYHWKGNQDECDLWVKHLDVSNYQKTIEEIDTYGWNDEHKFYLLGDCAVVDVPGEPSKFIFPDKSGIIWIHGTGYKNSDTMGNFTTQPPVLFPGAKEAKKDFEAIDWEQERLDVIRIWEELQADFRESFGGHAGTAFVASFPMYLAHAEIRSLISGKPSLWVQGEKGSGKTKSVEYAMRMIGYPVNFGYITLGGTKVGLERSLSQMHNLPFLVDEWRYENVTPNIEELIRSCFNEISTAKGTPNGNKGVRKSTPLTMPIICGENATNDPALRSRYLKIIAASTHSSTITGEEDDGELEAKRRADGKKRDERFFRIMERSEQYYRIGRYLFRHRAQFAQSVVKHAKDFAASPTVMSKIGDSRSRQVFGCFFGSWLACQELFYKKDPAADTALAPDCLAAMQWFMNHGAESTQETEQEVFRRQFFRECVTMIDRGVHGIDKLIRVRPGYLDENGKVKLYTAINEPNARLYVLVAGSELYQEHAKDKRQRGETPSITRTNIMAELRQQVAWVPAPKPPHGRQHRFGIPGEKNSSREWWVMDFKRLDSDLKSVFQSIYERELEAASIDPEAMQQALLTEPCPI
jgi:hypothetical protein